MLRVETESFSSAFRLILLHDADDVEEQNHETMNIIKRIWNRYSSEFQFIMNIIDSCVDVRRRACTRVNYVHRPASTRVNAVWYVRSEKAP